ncbi:MAG: hypothetical protein HY901_06880 [Deltaproteobacteria bacterium]|nr:hypothetical protein [Deltaproteobacteria bacterium]
MKPWTTLAKEPAPDGRELILQERDGVFAIRVGGCELMSSARHGSEEAMAQAGLEGRPPGTTPAVLIGGLGLGYTLRAALDRLPAHAHVVVAEVSKPIVTWNRGPLARLAGAPLDDPRVQVETTDIGKLLPSQRGRFDAILLDVDNGPSALFQAENQRLYGPAGIAAFRDALVPGGALVVWSAGPEPRFLSSLREAGFDATERRVSARARGSAQHVLFVGRLPLTRSRRR